MEIKQGDKVRVSKDAPELYTMYGQTDWESAESTVEKIDGDAAEIKYFNENSDEFDYTAIPTKYLVKVDAEKKEAKFKVGQFAMFKGRRVEIIGYSEHYPQMYRVFVLTENYHTDAKESDLEPYTEPTAAKFKVGDRVKFKNIYELQKAKDKSFRWMLVMFASKEATITAVEDNGFYRVDIDPSIGGINDDMIECKVEPTEQTEAEKTDSDVPFSIFRDDLLSNPQIVNLHNGMHYWQCYEANLAKEVALKVANKYNDPKEAAEYAVKVAKAVVEGLKRK